MDALGRWAHDESPETPAPLQWPVEVDEEILPTLESISANEPQDDEDFEEWPGAEDTTEVGRLLNTVAQKSQHVVTRWNAEGDRALRVTQKELSLSGGNKIVTQIEVIQRDIAGDDTIIDNIVFSVKHSHGAVWRKQSAVHKNLLLCSELAGVECPIELPEDSHRLYSSIDNPQHVQIYLERVIPHFRFRNLPSEVSAFWWRAVGEGSLIFQNWATGRLLILPCKGRGIPKGAQTLRRALDLLQEMPIHFFTPEDDYQTIKQAAEEEEDESYVSLEKIASAIQSWALEDGVSPWMTKLIVKSQGSRKGQILQYRYSIGVDVHENPDHEFANNQQTKVIDTLGTADLEEDEDDTSALFRDYQLFISIQVHSNEPLSRELKAYPVCMIPVPIESSRHRDLTVVYLRSLWFLRKLFEYHVNADVPLSRQREEKLTRPAALQPAYIRDYKHTDERDITYKSKLIGGARLATRPRRSAI